MQVPVELVLTTTDLSKTVPMGVCSLSTSPVQVAGVEGGTTSQEEQSQTQRATVVSPVVVAVVVALGLEELALGVAEAAVVEMEWW